MKKRIFLSYAHEDELYKSELDRAFSALKRSNKIELWHDRCIKPGQEWDDIIKEEIKKADIILLLLSNDFLASNYIWDKEIKLAIERHRNNEASVVPIFTRPCDIKDMPFADIQGRPLNAKPISEFENRDTAYLEIIEGIRRIL